MRWHKRTAGWQRLARGLLSAALVVSQWPPSFGPLVAEANHLGSASASSGSAPPPNVSAIQAFQPDLFTGRAATAVPIAVPPGRKGLQPSVGLSYSSSGRNGWLGVGWSLDVGYIELDTKDGVPTYDGSDTYMFMFQGIMSELVQLSDGTYRAKDEGAFLKFVYHTDTISWDVFDKSGTHYVFGQASASRIETGANIFRWALDEVVDVNGNVLTVSYTKDANQLYLAQIRYTGHEDALGTEDLAPANQVDFFLEDRTDSETSYRAGFAITTAKRLQRIDTYATVDGELSLARSYELAYIQSALTGRSLLNSVTQVGWNGTRLPAITFTYTQESPTYLHCHNCVPEISSGNHGWQIQTQVGNLFPREDQGNNQILWPTGYFDPGVVTWTEDVKYCEEQCIWFICWDHCEHYTETRYATIPPVSWSSPFLELNGSNGSISWSTDTATGNLSVTGPQDSHIVAQTWLYNAGSSKTVSVPVSGSRADVFYVPAGGTTWQHATDQQVTLSTGWTVVAVTAYNETGSFSVNISGNLATESTAMNHAQFIGMDLSGDFNGDGYTDLAHVSPTDNHWHVALNSPSAFGQEQTWLSSSQPQETVALVGDVQADGKADLILWNSSSGLWQVATSTGSSFEAPQTWHSGFGEGATPFMGDFNGDQLLDVGTFSSGTWTIALSTGSGFASQTSWLSGFGDGASPLTGDFNGDGLTDVGTASNGTISVALSTGSQLLVQPTAWATSFGSGQDVTTADLNGDSLTDVVYYDKAEGVRTAVYAPSTGGAFGASQTLMPEHRFELYGADDVFQVGNFNGNGLAGFGVFNAVSGAAEIVYPLGSPPDLLASLANGLGATTTLTYTISSTLDNTGGDGLVDLAFTLPVVTQVDIADGLGHTYTTTYRYSGGKYDAETREFWGFEQADVIDARGTTIETHFLQDTQFKGRIGWQQTLDVEGRLYAKTEHVWNCVDPNVGVSCNEPGAQVNFVRLDQTDAFVYDGDDSFRQTRNRLSYDNYGNLTRTDEDGDVALAGDERATTIEYLYNTDAWILNKPSLTQTLDANDVVVAQRRFLYDGATDWATQPVPTVGHLTAEEEWLFPNPDDPNDPDGLWLTTQMHYDPYGNVDAITDALGRTTTNLYDAEAFTYLVQIENVLTHTRAISYDPRTGQVTSSTDQNGLSTLTTYDDVGRIIATAYVDPQTGATVPLSVVVYDLTTVPSRTTTTTYTEPDAQAALTTHTFTDGLGRTIQTRSPAENPTQQVVTGVVEFDARGHVTKQWMPYFSSSETPDRYTPVAEEPNWETLAAVTYTYDAVGRALTTTDPDGSITSVGYSDGAVTVTDANGHQTRRTHDAHGRLIQVGEIITEAEVYVTTYVYDTLNNLTQLTDAQGNLTTVTYDSLGRKTAIDDPDMGHWEYAYDAVDNLIEQTDATGQTLTFAYDALNRLMTKAEGGGARPQGTNAIAPVTYTYDNTAKAYAKGRLTEISDGEGPNSSDFVYDSLGRLVQETRQVNDTDYTIERTYDLLGRLTSLTYPDDDVLYYIYNAQGGLEQVFALLGGLPEPGEPEPDPEDYVWYITNIDYNAAGQVLKIEYGNGVVSDYTYDPQTLRLDRLQTTGPGALISNLQDLQYAFDPVGNVQAITNYLDRTHDQSFQYDGLDRLTSAVGPYDSLTYAYDPLGNMLEKDGVAMTYGEEGAPPHAVTSMDDWTMTYDANGNLIGKTQADGLRYLYTYDAENRLAQVERRDYALVTVDVPLSPGWNFITLPVDVDDASITSVLSSLQYGVDYDQVSRYDSAAGTWQHYLNHPEGNDFETMALGEAYALYCLNPEGATWTVTGHRLANIKYRSLAANLNLLGMANDELLSVEEALEGLAPGIDYTALYHWNTATQDWDVYNGTDQQEFAEIVPGKGYWLDTTAATSWPLPFEQDFTTFAYDGDGGRVSKTTDEGTTIYLGQLYEKAADGTVTKSFFAGAQRIALERITRTQPLTVERFWFHGDHLGSSSVVTNEAGESVQQLSYTPYGSIFSNTGTEDFPQKFTGQIFDAETGLYFYNARYYDPHLGRFTQPDPFVQIPDVPQTLNRYSYVRNSPVNYVDPSGHFFFNFFGFGIEIGNGRYGISFAGFTLRYDAHQNELFFGYQIGLGSQNSGVFEAGVYYNFNRQQLGTSSTIYYGQSTLQERRYYDFKEDQFGASIEFNSPYVYFFANTDGQRSLIVLGEVIRIKAKQSSQLDESAIRFNWWVNFGTYQLFSAQSFGQPGQGFNPIGKLWTLPNTALGLALGVAGLPFGAKVSFGNNAIQFSNMPFGNGAITFGNTILYGKNIDPTTPAGRYNGQGGLYPIGDHERAHTYQYEILGPFYALFWIAGGGPRASNPLEDAADNYATGTGSWWP